MTALLVALGAACGGLVRLALSTRWAAQAQLATLGANTLGSFLIGYAAGAGLSDDGWALVAVGFCGALTTWSTMAVQVVDSGWRVGIALAAATVVLAVAAAGLGFFVA